VIISGTFLLVLAAKLFTTGCVLHVGLHTALYIVWGADCTSAAESHLLAVWPGFVCVYVTVF